MIYISSGGEFIKCDGEIELIPRGTRGGKNARTIGTRISPVFSLRRIKRDICVRKYFPIPRHSLFLSFPSIKSTPPAFFLLHSAWHNVVRECHLLTRVSVARSDPAYVPIYFPAIPVAAFLDRSGSRMARGEWEMIV